MAELDLPQTISKLWTKYPSTFSLTRQELAEATAFVEQWERGFVSLDSMPSSVRQDLISYLCSLVNRTRQVGYREPTVDLDGRPTEPEESNNEGTLLQKFTSALAGLSKKSGRS